MISEHKRFVRIFAQIRRGLLHAEVRRTGVEPLNLVIIHIMRHLLSDIFEMCGSYRLSNDTKTDDLESI